MRWVRRAAATAVFTLPFGLGMLLAPRPAYANMEASIAITERQPVVVVKTWRNIRGEVTPPSTKWIGKGIVREKNAVLDWSDDGKTMVQYWPSMKRLFVDSSHPASFQALNVRDQASGLKAWASARGWAAVQQDLKASYHGQRATKLFLRGSYRDAGKDNSIEMTVITEPKNGRVLYTETWRDGHSWADFNEYSYPPQSSMPFEVQAPKGTPSTDLRDVRKELAAKASAAKPVGGDPALVAAFHDAGGNIWVVTKGGAMPDPRRPQSICVNGEQVGSGDTYAFLIPGQTPFPALGKDVHLQTAGSMEWRDRIPDHADLEVWSWKTENGKSVPNRKVKYANVEILQIPVIALLRPVLASQKRDPRELVRRKG